MTEVIQKIPAEVGASVILVDHDMSLVSACCQTTAVIDFGKLIASGPTRRGTAGRARDAGLPRNGDGAVSETASTLEDRRAKVSRGGKEILHGISLKVPRGEVTTLLGPNGAGKSTMVLSVGGVLRSTDGEVSCRRYAADEPPARADPPGRGRDRPRGAPASARPDGRGQPPRRHLLARPRGGEAGDRVRDGAVPASRDALARGRADALRRRAADGRARPGARLAAEVRARRRAVARPGAGRRAAPDPALEEAACQGVGVLLIEQFVHVALGLAQERVRARGRPHRLRGHRRRPEGEPGEAPLRVPPARPGGRRHS